MIETFFRKIPCRYIFVFNLRYEITVNSNDKNIAKKEITINPVKAI